MSSMGKGRKERTSTGYRSSVLRRLVRYAREGRHDDVEALMTSDEFVHALARMNTNDRRITMQTAGDAMRLLWERSPIPPPTPVGVRHLWDAAAERHLREIAARHGVRPGLDRVIAREMNRPLMAVTLARYRYLGRIRAPQPNRKSRKRGRQGAGVSAPGSSHQPAESSAGKYMGQPS